SGERVRPRGGGIWSVGPEGVVGGTDNTSPTWSGSAGGGWVACAYSGVTLPAGDYKVAVFYGGGAQWYQATVGYWSTGAGASGITAGPVIAPGTSAATSPAPSTHHAGSWNYPVSYAASGNGENFWVDVEVTPS